MTRRIVVMETCSLCQHKLIFCPVCGGTGQVEHIDLSAKAQKVLEDLAEDSVEKNISAGWFECAYCDWGKGAEYEEAGFRHADDCPHVLAKEVLGT